MDRPDPDKLKQFSFLLFSKLEGAVTSGMVHLGDKLGLYQVLAETDAPVSSTELAQKSGLNERWIREWLHNQGAAKLLVHHDDGGDGRFSLSPEGNAVLADPNSPTNGIGMFGRLPDTMRMLEQLPDSFRTGLGHDYDSHGPTGAAGIERSFGPWYQNFLLPVGLPALDGVVDKLEAGAVAADVGCGAGMALLMMADRFPNSRFHGYDISQHAIERGRMKQATRGLENAAFHDPRVSPLPDDHSLDLVTTFDCIHDMTRPDLMIDAIYRSLKPDGTWLLVDIKAKDTYTENLRNPMAALMYGISIMSCMNSALSEPDGLGLGTLGLPERRAREMAAVAGFTRFTRLDIDHALNAFFEVRP